MLHNKLHGNGSIGFWRRFLNVFNIYGRGHHLGHVTSIMLINFHLVTDRTPKTYTKNLVKK